MANLLLPTAKAKFLSADLDWTSGTWKILLVDDTYEWDEAHTVLDDVDNGARVGSAAITGRSVDGAVAKAAAVQIPAEDAKTVTGVWILHDTGTESTSELVAWVDRTDADEALALETTGTDVLITWSPLVGGVFKL